METKGSVPEKKPSALHERLRRVGKCTILFMCIAVLLAFLAAQFLRMKTPQGTVVAVVISIIGVGFLIYFVLHVYKDLCGIEKPSEEHPKR